MNTPSLLFDLDGINERLERYIDGIDKIYHQIDPASRESLNILREKIDGARADGLRFRESVRQAGEVYLEVNAGRVRCGVAVGLSRSRKAEKRR